MAKTFWLFFVAVILSTQTKPRPEQIRNAQQVRVCYNPPACVDPRVGTLISVAQTSDGRFVDPHPQVFNGTPDEGKPTICFVSFKGVGNWVQPGAACFSQFGLTQLLLDPAWLAWWNAHQQ